MTLSPAAGLRVIVKIGGAALEDAAGRARFAAACTGAVAAGHALVIVHGGGAQVAQRAGALGLEERRIAGLRVTDSATADVVLGVLGGEVNRRLVAALGQAGLRAVGLTGADGALFRAEPLRGPAGEDLGHVGRVTGVDAGVLDDLQKAGLVPVVATVAPPVDGEHFQNVNADHLVAPLAAAWGADAVLFLSGVPAVLDADRVPVARLSPSQAASLRASGVVSGGMIPKVDAALASADAAPTALVRIASGQTADAINRALAGGTGTTFSSSPMAQEAVQHA